jgi:hypothetical protein
LFLFADDTSILLKGDNLDHLIDSANLELQKITNWLTVNKMALNTSKTKYIIFRAKGKRINTDKEIILNFNEIGTVNLQEKCFPIQRISNDAVNYEDKFYKLLGVYIDEYLSFDFHIKFLIAKLSRALFCIRRAANKLNTKSLKLLYNSMFHSHLLYCNIIINSTSKTNLNKISAMQRKIIRIINFATYRAPTNPLFLKSNILPFEKQILFNQLIFMHSIFYDYAPLSIQNLFTKNNMENRFYEFRNIPDFIVPFARIDHIKRMPTFLLPSIWNNAGTVTYYSNKVTFMIALREELLNNLNDG